MKNISVHLDEDLAARFSTLARAHGGKSALLRQLVRLSVEGRSSKEMTSFPAPAGRAVHLSVRLSENEVAEVKKAAADRSMKPSQWLRSVVRVRLGAGTQYSVSELHELRALTNQVRKIGVNLNQLTHAANEARLKHVPFAVDKKALNAVREEVSRTLTALQLMARGNVRFWEGSKNDQ